MSELFSLQDEYDYVNLFQLAEVFDSPNHL